jgi:hypothetical protein
MQIQINKFLVVLLASVLLGIGCAPPNTSQNNGMTNSNQNVSNQNTPNQNTPAITTPHLIVCGGVNQQDLINAIKSLPPELKNQFKEVNSGTGTISLSYDAATQELIFKGYLTSDGNNLRLFFNRFDTFRGRQCVKNVSFQGDTANTKFEWHPATPITPTGNCKTDVDTAINNSSIQSQINKNFYYLFDEGTKVLTFSGFIGGIPNSGQLNRFLGSLQNLMANGCISKIVFESHAKADEKTMLRAGFGWMLCEAPLVECAGECVSVCAKEGNTNANTNR